MTAFPGAEAAAPRFAAVGDAFEDRYLPPVGRSFVGGNAANVAVQLARLGARSAFLGAVGCDAAGRRITRALRDRGVDVSRVRTLPPATARCDIALAPGGDRSFLNEAYGAAAVYRPDQDDLAWLAATEHVHVGWLNGTRSLQAALSNAPPTLSVDTEVNSDDGGFDVAFGSAGGDPEAARRMLDRLAGRNRLAVVTRGAAGAIASDGERVVEVGVRAVDVIDTTGAGDAFVAGFLPPFRAGADLATCLERARDAAADACTHLGGFRQPGAPLDPP